MSDPGDAYLNLLKTGYFPLCDEGKFSTPTMGENLEKCSPGFRFLFEKYRSHLSLYHRIPTQLVLDTMNTLCEQFWGEFVETTDNKEGLEIAPIFFKWLFWSDYAYLTYEDFGDFLKNADVEPSARNEVERILEDNIIPEGKSFQLGYKGQKDHAGDGHFVHVQTGLEVVRPKGQEEMIEVSGNGYDDSNRFMKGFNLAYSMLISKENIKLLEHLCTKRMKVHFMNEVDRGIMELNNSVYNGHPFFFDKTGNFAILSTNEVMPSKDFKDFQTTVMVNWDREMAELGRVSNTNPKMERMTTGENYKDLMPIANRQRLTLDRLKLLSKKALEKGSVRIEFAMNGIPERLPLEGDAEQPRPEESQALTGAVDNAGKPQFKPFKQ